MLNRKVAEAVLWKFTHRDFRGRGADGVRRVLHLNQKSGGTESWPLSSFTDEEVVRKLSEKARIEYARRTRVPS